MNRVQPWHRLVEIALWLVAAMLIVVPTFVLIAVALRASGASANLADFSGGITFQNFVTAWVQGNFGNALVNTVLITVATVVLVVLFSAMISYPLARSTRAWSKGAFGFLIAGLIVPSVGTIPLYITMKDLGLVGTPWALLIIYVGAGMPINVLLYTTFMRTVPREYEEAAVIDGAGAVRMFASVVFPLMRPVTATVIILTTINTYNEFFLPLLYLNGSPFSTLPLALREFSSEYFTNWGVIFAGLLISILPILVFYLFLQRHVINGFAGGLKG